MSTEEKSNIVSENEFLQSLGLQSKPEPVKPEAQKPEEILEDIINPKVTEEVVEPVKEEVKEKEEAINKQEEEKLKRFGVKDTINSLIENEDWVDVAVKYNNKEYESIEALLNSEKHTKELFDSLSQAQKKLRQDTINEEYVSIKGKDETKVKLINAILSNVDYEDLLQYNKQVVEPVTKLDFANQDSKITENFIRQCLRDIDNIPEKYIEIELNELKKDFKLIEKAEAFQEIVIKNFNDEVDARRQEAEAIKAKEAEDTANSVKSFNKVLKEKGFSDSFIKKASQLRYTKDTDGKFHHEKLLSEKLQDEEFGYKYIHFLLDPEDFLKREKSTVKTEETKKIMELMSIIPKEKGAKATKDTTNYTPAEEEFLNLLNVNEK